MNSLLPPVQTDVPRPRSNLVQTDEELIGRSDEMATLAARIRSGERFVVLCGPAGIGKSAVARVFASQQLEGYRESHCGGIWFCDLSRARGRDEILAEVARVLGLAGSQPAMEPGAIAVSLLSLGKAALVLDGLDQALDSAKEICETWNQHCPELLLVATSRSAMGCRRAFELVLSSLALPKTPRDLDCASVRLLLERARLSETDYVEDVVGTTFLTEIATELDGIPLALELAASRIRFWGLREVHARLHEKLTLLRSNPSGGMHVSLEDSLRLSWDSLNEMEQRVFGALSVFRGEFEFSAVVGVLGEEFSESILLDALESLQKKSLLRKISDSNHRVCFSMYRPILEFATTRFSSNVTAKTVRERHAEFFAHRGENMRSLVYGPEAAGAFRTIERDRENLIAILESDVAIDLRVTAAAVLEPLMITRGPFDRYESLIQNVLACTAGQPSSVENQVRLLLLLSNARVKQGKIDAAQQSLERAMALTEDMSLPMEKARVTCARGALELARADFVAACECFETAIPVFQNAEADRDLALALGMRAAAEAARGLQEEAWSTLTDALNLHEKSQNLREAAMVSGYLGNMALEAQRFVEARAYFDKAASIQERIGDLFGASFTHACKGWLAHLEGSVVRARSEYDVALEGFQRVGALRYVGAILGYRAIANRELGEKERAGADFEQAIHHLRAARDGRFENLFRANLSSLLAEAGLYTEAQRLIDLALAELERIGDPSLLKCAELHAAELEYLKALTKSEQDRNGAQSLEASAKNRVLAVLHTNDGGPLPADTILSLRVVSRVLPSSYWDRSTGSSIASKPEALVIEERGRWVKPPFSDKVDLTRRPTLGRILVILARQHHEKPGKVVAYETFAKALWPRDPVIATAVRNRIRVSITYLRKAGLEEAIKTSPDGYFFDPSREVILAAANPLQADGD